MTTLDLHLASASPRRSDILTSLGLRFSVAATDVDETPVPGESVAEMVLRLAALKADAGRATAAANLPVVGADTAVTLDDRVFGKPESREHALDMLSALSGRVHRVLTGVAVYAAGNVATALSATEVEFRDIDPDEADLYWQSGEPAGKAGAYAIQGLGGVFVRSLHGSYSGVVGLPVYETAALLRAAGVALPPNPGAVSEHD